MELQRTFKESYMKTLRDAVKSGASINLYGADFFEIDSAGVKRLANVYAPDNLEEKMVDLEYDDFEAAKTIYEAYKDISPLLASNEAFWAYLTHTTLFHYTQRRWDNVLNGKATEDYILDHWFIGPNRIMRNAAASAWWTAHNTIDETRSNKYELTAIMFKNYSLRTNTLGISTLIRHREAMLGILEFLVDNTDVTTESFEARGQFIAKYFNRLGAVKQLAYLDRNYFRQKCESMKDRILSITSRDQVINDESLYND